MAYDKGYKTTATLRMGSKGEAVKQLQYRLLVTADGIFGTKTQAAVKSFQKAKKLQVDGIAGKSTLTALGMYGSTSSTGTKTTTGSTTGTKTTTGSTTTTTTSSGTGVPSTLPGTLLDKMIGGVILYGIYKTFQKIF